MAKIKDDNKFVIVAAYEGEEIDIRDLAALDYSGYINYISSLEKENSEKIKESIRIELEEKYKNEHERMGLELKSKYNDEINELNTKLKIIESARDADVKNAELKIQNENNKKITELESKISNIKEQKKLEIEAKVATAKELAANEKRELELVIKDLKNEQQLAEKQREIDNGKIREEIRAQFENDIITLKNENDQLKQNKRATTIKEIGNNFESYVHGLILDENDPETVQKIVAGQSGADFIYNVKHNDIIIGNITIECKNPFENSSYDSKWIPKLIKDANKNGSKYKFLVTYASPDKSYDEKHYWIEDRENNVYVIRPDVLPLIINLFKNLIIKENFVQGIADAEELNAKLNKLNTFLNVDLITIREMMTKRKLNIEQKCATIDNATEKIRSEARLLAEKDIKELITKIQGI